MDVMDAICEALQVPGAHLVYRQADPDHHRLDTTVLGDRDAVGRSAIASARVAAALIDMDQHHGGHPRMGAVDVIPFMPVRDVSMQECVSLAVEVGETLARELSLPVYLYDRAARTPDRASLAEVRRGEYEGLREAVCTRRTAARSGSPHDREGRRHGGRRPEAARRVQRVSRRPG